MKSAFFLLSALLLSCLCLAELQPFPYSEFVPDNMSYSITSFAHDNQPYQAIIVQQQIYAILAPGMREYLFEPITSLDAMEAPLYSYYLSQGYSPDAVQQLSAVHAGIDSIRNASKPGEAACRTLLGTDRLPCDSFQDCLRACYSVTSFCQPVALGAGQDFVNAMWEFENDSNLLDQAYANESAAYGQISSSQSGPAGYLYSLEQINRVSTMASSNPLFYGYSYCFEPDYSMQQLTNLQLLAQQSYANFSVFYSLGSEAAGILNLTDYGVKKMEYLSSLAQQPAQANATNSSASAGGTGKYGSLNSSAFRLGPYNVSQQQGGQNASFTVPQAAQPHLDVPTLLIAFIAVLLCGAVIAFLCLRLGRRGDR